MTDPYGQTGGGSPYGQPPSPPAYGQTPGGTPYGQTAGAPSHDQTASAPPYGQAPGTSSPYGHTPGASPYGQGAGSSPYDQTTEASARARAADGAGASTPDSERSLGELVGEITSDMTRLLRQEIELARAELTAEARKAGKAAGMLGGAGFAGYMVAVLLSFAVAYGLSNVMDLGWSTLLVAAVWAAVGAVLFARGRAAMRTVSPKPEQTIETLKEDVEWARHPTR